MTRLNLPLILVLLLLLISCAKETSIPEEFDESESRMTVMELADLSDFDSTSTNWQIAGQVNSIPEEKHSLNMKPGKGILANSPVDGGKNIFTAFDHGDIDLELDFLMPKGSNSGIYLMGRYEVQLLDSWGVEEPTHGDCGGIYQRWDDSRPEGEKGYEGIPPRMNASRAPGLWQHLKISFKAPRYDKEGNKIANAKMVEVEMNGVIIHENVSLSGPTRAAGFEDEQPRGPIMIQGDHGPVAFRNIRYRLIDDQVPMMSSIHYKYYELDGTISTMPDYSALSPVKEGQLETFDTNERGTRQSDFGFRYSSTLTIDKAAEYTFTLASDDGGILYIDGKELVNHDGNHGMTEKENSIMLTEGPHEIQIDYFQAGGGFGIRLYIESEELPKSPFYTPLYMLKEGSRAANTIILETGDRPLLHRGFFMYEGKKRTKTMGVGDNSGLHYVYDLEAGAPIKVWRGNFLDAGPMWIARGETQLAVPQGPGVEIGGQPSLALMNSPSKAWPDSMPDQANFTPDGYSLDVKGYPTFTYSAYNVKAEDQVKPNSETASIERELRFSGDSPKSDLWSKIASGSQILNISGNTFAIDQEYYLTLSPEVAEKVEIRTNQGVSEMIVPVLREETETVIRYSVLW